MRIVRTLIVAVVVVAWSARPTLAQPLADRIPSDALLYVGWAGSEHLAPAYAQSHLKGVIDASNLPQLFTELGPRIVRRIQLEGMMEGDPLAKELLPALLSFGEIAWRRPTALYFGPLDYSGKVPMPKVAILCDAGKDAQALADTANKVVAQIPADVPLKIKVQVWPGDVVSISTFELPPKIDETLAQREQFQAAVKQGRPDAALTAFFDAEKVLNVASLAINMAADAKTKQTWQRMLLTTGVAGIKRLIYTAGFDGKDWGSQAFIDCPQPRMGLLATLLDPEPVSEDLLKLAPQSSTWVAATRCDLAPILGGVRNTIARLDADASRNVEDAIKEVNKALGCDLQRDLLAGLGDQWLAFNSEQTGRGILGLVLVNPLRNPAKVEQALLAFERMANTEMKRDADRGEPAVSIETAKVGDLSIHYLAIPALAPCWAIKDGRLYVAAFPQILEAAAAETGTGGQGVLGNAGFNAARERVGVSKNAISISYMDLPKLAPRGYQMVLALQRGALGAADLFGMQTPALALPPLNKIAPHLSTSVGATWVDDLGWHYRGVTPFPAADVLGGEQSLVTTVAPAAVAALIPAAARAKQQARMVQGANNLRQIGQGIFLYANEHQGDLPPDLGAIAGYLMAPTMFQAPEHYGRVPLPPPTAKPEEVAKWVNANTDYVYEGLKFKKITTILNPAQAVMAHEKYELKAGGPVNVLYGDGHVELNAAPIVKERVEAQTREAAARNVN